MQLSHLVSRMFRLSLPVVVTYLGLMTMGLVDLLFVGRVGSTAVGAVGVSTAIFSWFMIFGIGLLTGMDYPVAFAFGEGRIRDTHATLVQGLLVALVLSVPLTLVMVFISLHAGAFGFNPEIVPETGIYLSILSWSLVFTLVFSAIHRWMQAIGLAIPAMIILLIANGINALANYVLVFGHWGAPAMGVAGSAWATLISRVFMVLALAACALVWDARVHRHPLRTLYSLPFRYQREKMKELLRLGLPSALQMLFEVGVFATATALAARLTAPELAAHQIVLTTASITFMVPLGISTATAVLVGQALGEKDPDGARTTGWLGFILGTIFMICSALTMLIFPEIILGVYTRDAQVVAIGQSLLLVAGLFQLSDGAQVVGAGALRGIADTRSPMIVNLCGHWLLGLPLGIYLCFGLHRGVQGLWVGLSSGLTAVALSLVVIWWLKSRRIAVLG